MPVVRPDEAGQAGNQRCLAGAVGAEQAEELALGDFQRNAVKRAQTAEVFYDLLNGNGDAHGIGSR